MRYSRVSQIAMTALLLVTGILIVAQLRTQRHLRALTYSADEQVILLSELVDVNRRLREEVELLTAQRTAYQEESRGASLEDLVVELNQVRVLNGMIEVSGPGVELTLDGPLNALDLQDLVNELRNAGAEAIAVNGRRLVASSVFTVVDRGMVRLDGENLDRPYRLRVICDPDTIERALLRRGGLFEVLRRTYPSLAVQITPQSQLVVDVHRPQLALRYAQSVK